MNDVPPFLGEELLKVESLQQSLQAMIANGDHVSKDIKKLVEYTHYYYALMEYQGVLWTRLKLMKDERYEGLLLAIEMVCDALGREETETVEDFHRNMKQECILCLEEITGESMENYDGIDVEFRD